jgi:formylglycine-generating enzyme required for sulfatase activity/tRNA A-37 threonylcarbamoyl transferase component Bud32
MAMILTSVADLIAALRLHGMLELAQLAEVTNDLQAAFASPRPLAEALRQRGWLTPYQVTQLFETSKPKLALGPYLLLEPLGEGSLGPVFKARQQRLGKLVALKLFRNDRLARPEMARRFFQEAQAAAQLNHEHVVFTYDADQIDDVHFLATEYLEGADLARLVRQDGPLPVGQACDYIRQAASGLAYAHQCGLVHRNVKPSNLFLTARGSRIKLLDLGLARWLWAAGEDGSQTLTPEGSVIGTPDYIAPEQALDPERVDIRADLYSLGCTFYYLLTGRPPFPGGSLTKKLLKHQFEMPEPVDQVRPEVPPPVACVVQRLMAKAPADRFQTPAELTEALMPAKDEGKAVLTSIAEPTIPEELSFPISASLPGSPDSTGRAARAQRATRRAPGSPAGPWASLQRWRRPLIAGLALNLVGIAVLLFLLVGRPGAEEENASGSLKDGRSPTQKKDVTPESKRALEKDSAEKRTYATAPAGPRLTNTIGMQLVRIPAGTFQMGSNPSEAEHRGEEGPVHEVTISKPFFMGIHQVTVGNFRAFVQATGHRTEAEEGRGAYLWNFATRVDEHDPNATWEAPGWPQSNEHPVVCVSWNDAQAFCGWLSTKEGREYRLPTEAEWEYACRAGTETAYSFGDDALALGQYAWYADNANAQTHAVGKLLPNRWGLYDIQGNVWQWCADYYDPNYYQSSPATDPPGPASGQHRVVRGGCWNFPGQYCRAADRDSGVQGKPMKHVGFRVLFPATP